ncbi:MAG: DNA/RNA non-specific endonuclease [Planctomycetaceae bacterium]
MAENRADQLSKYLRKIVPVEKMAERATERTYTEAAGGGGEQEEVVRKVLEKVERNESLLPFESNVLEAIILPRERPVVFVRQGRFEISDPLWSHLANTDNRGRLEAAIPAIGRIEIPSNPRIPYGGTGFVVGDGLLMTNRHVAELFAQGLGTRSVRFRSGESAAIDFKREHQSDDSQSLVVEQVLLIHPYWDMALLKVSGLPASIRPLSLAIRPPEELAGREVAVVGYPAKDWRNNTSVQDDVFGGVYNVKRLQPGKLRDRKTCPSFGKQVNAMTHDCSTLGGNSGSAVIDVATGQVVGLHFAGIYLEDNYAVPTYELARDTRVVDLGLNFPGSVGPTTAWASFWDEADGQASERSVTGAQPPGGSSMVVPNGQVVANFLIPLQVTISLGAPVTGTAGPGAVSPPAAPASPQLAPETEEKVPVIYPDMNKRRGYDPNFLALADGVEAPLPELTARGLKLAAKLDDGSPVLNYHKFSVVMHKVRRLALFTAANVDWRRQSREIDGKKPTRQQLNGFAKAASETWVTDGRIPEEHQLPDYFYTKDDSAFDKGHLVRRDDVAWGKTLSDMQKGNGDTFHTTNCSPQTSRFNQSKFKDFNWGELENMIQKQTSSEKVCIFSGPVLDPEDKFFHGRVKSGIEVSIQIPTRFWKIIVANTAGQPQAFGFVLNQDLDEVDLHEELIVPGEWKKFMKPLREIEDLLDGLVTLGPMIKWDQFHKV